MISRILVGFGILLMLFAVYSVNKLISIIQDQDKRTPWFILFLLIMFFLLGYVGYFYMLFTSINPSDTSSLLISSIFFFGAIFVIVVLSVNNSLIKGLNNKTETLENTNTTLKQQSEILQNKDKELEESRGKLVRKNEELEKVLEDFYTLRIGMTRDMNDGKVEEENKMIKERLEKLKNSP
jgi:ABC-type transport system involved in multi-copper enzyme maturation permease subunit